MKVLKFGGTSVKDSSMMNRVLDIAEQEMPQGALLVSSAMNKTTDSIIECFTTAQEKGLDASFIILKDIEKLHFDTAREFLDGEVLQHSLQKLNILFSEFRSLIKGIALLKACSPRSKDALLSLGERLSTTLLQARAEARGLKSRWVDARLLIKTNSDFGNAKVDFAATSEAVKKEIKLGKGELIITQGFIASDQEGVTTTLGRGGSDYSAAILGAELQADEVQIWTDVDGIMTSDPRVVSGVHPIGELTYNEAGELAYFGARVIHPATMQPAVRKGIPLRVLNTHNPQHPGTLIQKNCKEKGLKAISAKMSIHLVSINSSRMLNAYGFMNRIFKIFDRYEVSVDLISTSEVSISLSVEEYNIPEEMIEELEEIGQVSLEQDKAIVCLVGQDLWKDSAFISRTFSILEGVPIRMISLGASDINLSLVIAESYVDKAIQNLHDNLLG